jgi:hypothetical protein
MYPSQIFKDNLHFLMSEKYFCDTRKWKSSNIYEGYVLVVSFYISIPQKPM